MKIEKNLFDCLTSHPYLIGSYGFFGNSKEELTKRFLENDMDYFGYLRDINYKNPFKRFVLNEKAYEFFYKVDDYIPEIIEIE